MKRIKLNKRYIIIPIAMLVMLAASASPAMAMDCGDVTGNDVVDVGDLGLLDLKLSHGATLNCCDDDNVLEYSVTIIEDYSDSSWFGGLTRGQESYDALVEYIRDDAHWTERFYEPDDSVDEPDFGTSNSGYQGLDEADFHYHFGHGSDFTNPNSIALHDFSPWYSDTYVVAGEVWKKWDEDNEWTIIHSCYILDDHDDWKHALKYSHALMGFESSVPMHECVINNFLYYAINYDYTVYQAYRQGTIYAFGSDVTAAAIFDNVEQKNNDHLWGEGEVMLDEYPDDGDYWHGSWNCED